MAYDIIEVDVTINGTAYSAGDVLFELTEVPLPARACTLIHGFFEVQSSGQAAAESFNCMFFKSNVGGNLASGGINTTADISAANFALNKYIGEALFASETDADRIDNMALFVLGQMNVDIGSNPSFPSAMFPVLKGDLEYPGSTQHGVYAAGVVTTATPDFDAVTSAKLILHVEY